MGLDQYLLMSSEDKKTEGVLKIMDGAFGFGFGLQTDKKQIGYWRKAYRVSDFILELVDDQIDGDHNCVELSLSTDDLQKILDEANWKVENDDFENDWDKEDWKKTIEIMNNAIELAKTNQTAKFFYKEWF